MEAVIVSGFLAAVLAPLLALRIRRGLGWLLAVVPVGLLLLALRDYDPLTPVLATRDWVPSLGVALDFRLDGLSMFFVLLVTLVGAAVLVYTDGYTEGWQRRGGMFGQLLFFMAAMLGLVLAENVLLLYVFWELTTVASFLLIGFQHEKAESRPVAFMALLTTGAGGLLLLLGLILLANAAGSFELTGILAAKEQLQDADLTWPIVLLAAGALIKSGQFPFQFWLTRAMVAPTPVSTYLHAATMVKAGLYLAARFNPVFAGHELWGGLLLWGSLITMLVATWGAVASRDMKKFLAYTTVGSLAVALALVAGGSAHAARALIIFLLAHAAYKGSLFMVAGAVDHATGTRDVQSLSGLRHCMPLLAVVALLGALGLAEFGPQLSFVAKEEILEALHHDLGPVPVVIFALLASGFVVTAVVLGFQVFFGSKQYPEHTHAPALSMVLPPLVLASVVFLLVWAGKPLDAWLIDPAVRAITGGETAAGHFKLWHGFNWAFFVTLCTLLAGLLGGAFYLPIQRIMGRANGVVLEGTERLTKWLMRGIWRAAEWQTGALEHGRLPTYLLVMVVAATLFLAPWVLPASWGDLSSGHGLEWEDGALIILALAGATATLFFRNRFGIVAALSLVGYSITVIFARYSALDVAVTQVLVETLMVVLLAGVIRLLPKLRQLSSGFVLARNAVVALAAGAALFLTLIKMRTDAGSSRVSPFFLDEVARDPHRDNVVAAILTDFRVLDTLGEVTVLAIAAVGVVTLVRLARRGKEGQQP